MASQEDYLDSLLKDLNHKDTDVYTVGENEGKAESRTDMSDIEDLLRSVSDEAKDKEMSPEIDDLQDMSQEEIERLLEERNQKKQSTDHKSESEQDDIMDLLQQSDDRDLQEIHDLLQKSDRQEMVEKDSDSLDYQAEAPQNEDDGDRKDRKAQNEAKKAAREARKEQRKAAKEAKRAKKAHKAEALLETEERYESAAEEDDLSSGDSSDDSLDMDDLSYVRHDIADMPDLDQLHGDGNDRAHKGFFSRILDFFTEEEEEEESEGIKLSQENKKILKEMDKEKKNKKSSRKSKKTSGEGESARAGRRRALKKTKSNPAKAASSFEEGWETPGKKLSRKHILLVSLVCVSLGLSIIILASVSGDYAVKREGRAAYYEGDYQTCYQNLFGKVLNESEQVMFGKSESILRIRLWIREYELLVEEGAEVEALDSLIQSVSDYPSLYETAQQWNAGSEVQAEYAEILRILSEKYNLTQDQVQEIAAVPGDVEYTIIVTAVAQGTDYEEWKTQQNQLAEEEAAEPLPDELPEETELFQESFVDNLA